MHLTAKMKNSRLSLFGLFFILGVSVGLKRSSISSEYNQTLNRLEKIDASFYNYFAKGSFTHEKGRELLADFNVEQSNWALVNTIGKVLDKVDKFQEKLRSVGTFIRRHKFLEIDWRRRKDELSNEKLSQETYRTLVEQDTDLKGYIPSMIESKVNAFRKMSQFSYKFPEPQLIEEHYELSVLCKISSEQCIEAVKEVIDENQTHQKRPYYHLSRESVIIRKHLEPFQTFWQLFNFRTTASYYLCHYVLNKNPLLSQFGPELQSIDLKNELEYYRSLLQEDAKFQSALVSFCPDSCCAEAFFKENATPPANSSPEAWLDHCLKHPANPCSAFGKGNCRLSLDDNKDFNSLKRNAINYTCSCDSGYQYSVELMLCVDIDECKTGAHSCSGQGQTCFNIPGSFFCQCEFNYRPAKNDEFWSCVQDPFKMIGNLDQIGDK